VEPADEAEARAGAYVLLAELVASGPVPALRDAIAVSPLLADALQGYPSLDEAAADHQHAFGFCVPPVEGAFLDPEGRAGATRADAILATYARVGYVPDLRAEAAEHLATELRALGVLAGVEAGALRSASDSEVDACRDHARALLDEHLLRWLPELARAVERTGRAWPRALTTQILELLCLDRERLGGEAAPWRLEGEPLDLADPATDLRAIARYLTTPARCGVFLGKQDIARLARRAEVPRGFGGRALEMQHLLRGAARFEVWGELLADVEALLERATDPVLERAAAPWNERARETARLLASMRDADASESP